MSENQLVNYTFNGDTSGVERSINQLNILAVKMSNAFTKNTNIVNNTFTKMSKGASGFAGSFMKMAAVIGAAKFAGEAVKQSTDFIENINLFRVSMAEASNEAVAFQDKMANAFSIDPSNLMRSQGIFNLLSKSIGVTSKNANMMSENLTKLSVDLASLFNISVEQAATKLESGLVGYTRAVRDLGMNVGDNAIAYEAQRRGITESVENMSQAEKMQLRYSLMLKQSTAAQGDFARTIESPANMMRVLKEQLILAARAIGNVLLPALTHVLPYIIAFTRVVSMAINALASLVGYDAIKRQAEQIGDLGGAMSDFGDDTDMATDEAKKLGKELDNLQSFDELNVFKDPSSGGGAGGSGTGLDDFILDLTGYDNLMDRVNTTAGKLFENMKKQFENLGIDKLITDFKDVIQKVKDFGTAVWEGGFNKVFDKVWQTVKNLGTSILNITNWVGSLFNLASGPKGTGFENFGWGLGRAFDWVATSLLDISDLLLAITSGDGQKAWEAMGRVIDDILWPLREFNQLMWDIGVKWDNFWNNFGGEQIRAAMVKFEKALPDWFFTLMGLERLDPNTGREKTTTPRSSLPWFPYTPVTAPPPVVTAPKAYTPPVVTRRGGQATMATGGIVTGPTEALVGEAGTEAVLPLTNRNLMKYLGQPTGQQIDYGKLQQAVKDGISSSGFLQSEIALDINGQAFYRRTLGDLLKEARRSSQSWPIGVKI